MLLDLPGTQSELYSEMSGTERVKIPYKFAVLLTGVNFSCPLYSMDKTAGQSPAFQTSLAFPPQVSQARPVQGHLHELGTVSGETVRIQLLDYWDLKVTAVCHSQGNFLWNCNMLMALFHNLDATKHSSSLTASPFAQNKTQPKPKPANRARFDHLLDLFWSIFVVYLNHTVIGVDVSGWISAPHLPLCSKEMIFQAARRAAVSMTFLSLICKYLHLFFLAIHKICKRDECDMA